MSATPQIQERGRQLVESLAGVVLQARDLPALGAAMEGERSRLGMQCEAEYLAHLEGDEAPEDRASLVDLVVNNETYFFREPQHFAILRELLLGRGEADDWPDGQRFRVLCAGCATGEEAYSLAIELMELEGQLPGLEFEVLGVDISRRAVEVARRGVYGPNSFRRVDDEARVEAWFELQGDATCEVSERVKDRVAFHCLNLKDGEALRAAAGTADAIFFRNVLIYLSDAARLEVCQTLGAILRRPGYLFLGVSENPPAEVGGLHRQLADGVSYWTMERLTAPGGADAAALSRPVKDTVAPDSNDTTSPSRRSGSGGAGRRRNRAARSPSHPIGSAGQQSRPMGQDSQLSPDGLSPGSLSPDLLSSGDPCMEAVVHAREDRAPEAMAVLRGVIATSPDHPEACRLMAELYLDRAEFDEALRLGEAATSRDETLAWPYVLRGRAAHNTGDGAAAADELRKAIYYRPDWWPAHFYLAEFYRSQGQTQLARRAYANALRNLESGADESGRDCGAEIIGCAKADVAATCRANLERSEVSP